jgi:parvulin-like peptidyl-prolyl isomerase
MLDRFFRRCYGAMLFLVLAALAGGSATFAAALARAADPAPVAVVDGDPISRAEFQRAYRQAVEDHAQRGNPVDEAALGPVRQQVMTQLVEDRLFYQESRRRGIHIDDAAVTERLAEIRRKFADEADFQAHLKALQLDLAGYRASLAQSMAIKALLDQEVNGRVKVSDEEVQRFFESRPDLFRLPAKVALRWILLRLDPTADPDQREAARQRALAIRSRWEAGEDFADLARQFSEDPETAPEGLLPELEQRQVVHFFGPQVWDLAVGQVSPPLALIQGVCLVRMERRIPEQVLSLAEVRESVRRYLLKEKTARAQSAFARELRRQAKVQIYGY